MWAHPPVAAVVRECSGSWREIPYRSSPEPDVGVGSGEWSSAPGAFLGALDARTRADLR